MKQVMAMCFDEINTGVIDDEIKSFYDRQFEVWPELRERYIKLGGTKRRLLISSPFNVIAQFNPARKVSTCAKIDEKSIGERPCFLCNSNRPNQQIIGSAIPDFDILVNPFPILPVHFTIASKGHKPQNRMPIEACVEFVERYPSLVAFYNGANAGASAPDHLHFQAVLKSELPLLCFVEEHHPYDCPGVMLSTYMSTELPISFWSFVIRPDDTGLAILKVIPHLGGYGDDKSHCNPNMSNTFLYKDSNGVLRAIVFPRKKHRPDCYFADNAEERLTVSPGALDMAGIVVLPIDSDFDKITESDIRNIYSQTGLTSDEFIAHSRNIGF
jgi:hypothetical protein